MYKARLVKWGIINWPFRICGSPSQLIWLVIPTLVTFFFIAGLHLALDLKISFYIFTLDITHVTIWLWNVSLSQGEYKISTLFNVSWWTIFIALFLCFETAYIDLYTCGTSWSTFTAPGAGIVLCMISHGLIRPTCLPTQAPTSQLQPPRAYHHKSSAFLNLSSPESSWKYSHVPNMAEYPKHVLQQT